MDKVCIVVLALVVTLFVNVWESRVYLAVACYGTALAWESLGVVLGLLVGIGHAQESHIPIADAIIAWALFTLPIPATLIGLGTGNLYNHRWYGALIGFALSLLVLAGFLASA